MQILGVMRKDIIMSTKMLKFIRIMKGCYNICGYACNIEDYAAPGCKPEWVVVDWEWGLNSPKPIKNKTFSTLNETKIWAENNKHLLRR